MVDKEEIGKEEIGTALMIAGAFVAFVAVAFPQQVASGLATIKIDTTPPTINAMNPSGSQSSPTHFNPDTTVTLKMNSFQEKVNNPRVVVGGSTKSMTFDSSHATPYGTEYWYTTSWSTSGHTGETVKFVFKGDDGNGNTGSDTAYALVGSYADGYFTINGQKISKGATVTLGTRSVSLSATVTTSEKPDEVWYRVQAVDVEGYSSGTTLKHKSETVQTSAPYSWSYTFPKDGTYSVNGYFKSYGNNVQVMSIDTGINSPPVLPPFPSEAMIALGIGISMAAIGAVVRFRPEAF